MIVRFSTHVMFSYYDHGNACKQLDLVRAIFHVFWHRKISVDSMMMNIVPAMATQYTFKHLKLNYENLNLYT